MVKAEMGFQERLMMEKKTRFIGAVLRASEFLGLPKPPKVKFWKGNCPYGGSNEWTHIHWDIGIICVSESRLKQMSYEQIEETATHEVTHMKEHAHDDNFYIKHSDVKLGSWISSHNSKNKKFNVSKDISKDTCNYNLCEEKKPYKLYHCKLCGGYFCKKHHSPKMALMLGAVIDEKDRELKEILLRDYRRENAHPCWSYNNIILEEFRRKRGEDFEKLKEFLDKMGKLGPFGTTGTQTPKPPEGPKPTQVKTIVAIILMFIIIFVFFAYNKEIMKFLPMHQNTPIECVANYTKAYESTASFGRDPSAYCNKTCFENYNSTIYRIIEPNQTSKLTICWCDVNNCNT